VKRERVASGLLLIVGLGLALLGQFYFAHQREYVWDGLFFWCVATLSFGLLLRRVERREQRRSGWRLPSWVYRHPLRTLGAIGGVWLALLAGWVAHRWPETADFSPLLWLWLIGVAWFLLAFVPLFPVKQVWPRLTHWLHSHRVELAGLAALLLVALAVRAVALEHIPANLGGDEGTQGVAALELVRPPLGNPFSTGWFSVPTMSFLTWGLSMRIFGESIAGLRALSALIGTGTVLTTFLLARELWGRRVAWLAAIALTCSHFHVHFSRLGSNQIADGLLITLTLWLLVRGLRLRQAIYFALAGAVMGLGWYGYFGARLIGIVVALYLAWRMAVEYHSRPTAATGHPPPAPSAVRVGTRYGRLLLVLLGAALVVAAPLLFHYAAHPDTMTSRARQVSIFASGWLVREQVITGRSAASLLLQQFWKSISAFNYTLDPTFWYHPAIPLLDFVSGVLFILGLLWATVRCRSRPANGLLLLWFWLALILGWVATENPPSSMRLVIVAPALALLVGLGLNWLVEMGQRVVGGEQLLWLRVAVGILVVVAILNLHYYFVVYTPTRVYGNPTAEIATELARCLAQQGDDCIVYFHASPVMYWSFGTLRFVARGVEGMDVHVLSEGESMERDLERGARFVFLPHRLGELETIRTQYPGGVERSVYSSADGRLLYVLYEIGR